MNNNECCMTESRRCVADYEKTTREHLLEARDILRSVYKRNKHGIIWGIEKWRLDQ